MAVLGAAAIVAAAALAWRRRALSLVRLSALLAAIAATASVLGAAVLCGRVRFESAGALAWWGLAIAGIWLLLSGWGVAASPGVARF